mgnify:CR=1 FL=1
MKMIKYKLNKKGFALIKKYHKWINLSEQLGYQINWGDMDDDSLASIACCLSDTFYDTGAMTEDYFNTFSEGSYKGMFDTIKKYLEVTE